MLYNWRSALLSTEEVGRVMIEEFFNYYTLLIVDLNQSKLTTTATTWSGIAVLFKLIHHQLLYSHQFQLQSYPPIHFHKRNQDIIMDSIHIQKLNKTIIFIKNKIKFMSVD